MRVVLRLLLTLVIIQGCSCCCQDQSSCCQSYSSCCSSCNYQPRCCSNCCKQTQCCDSGNCCEQKCTVTFPTAPTLITTPADRGGGGGRSGGGSSSSSSNGTASSNVNNDINIATNLNISNTVTNTNQIHVPVNISITNINTIGSGAARPSPTRPTYPLPPTLPTGPTQDPIIESTTPSITIKPVYPILIPIPYPYPVHYPVHQGCCVIFQPCLQRQCHHTSCGNECVSPYMYQRQNPCHRDYGCSKKQSWTKFACHGPYFNCGYEHHDCSTCDFNFYKDYHTYERCHGCFY